MSVLFINFKFTLIIIKSHCVCVTRELILNIQLTNREKNSPGKFFFLKDYAAENLTTTYCYLYFFKKHTLLI